MEQNMRFLSPPQVAKILGTDVHKIHSYIAMGELRAINTSLKTKPRWKIAPDDFDAFLEQRASKAATPKIAQPEQRRASQRKKPINAGIPKTF